MEDIEGSLDVELESKEEVEISGQPAYKLLWSGEEEDYIIRGISLLVYKDGLIFNL